MIKQIEKKRIRLAAWESAIPPYQHKYVSEFIPLVDALAELRIKLVHCLDRAYGQKGLTKPERRTIANLIAELAGELAAARNDLEMKVLYNQYSQSDFDREEASGLNGMKSALEDVLGGISRTPARQVRRDSRTIELRREIFVNSAIA